MLYITITDENGDFHEHFIDNGTDRVDREHITEHIDRIKFG